MKSKGLLYKWGRKGGLIRAPKAEVFTSINNVVRGRTGDIWVGDLMDGRQVTIRPAKGGWVAEWRRGEGRMLPVAVAIGRGRRHLRALRGVAKMAARV